MVTSSQRQQQQQASEVCVGVGKLGGRYTVSTVDWLWLSKKRSRLAQHCDEREQNVANSSETVTGGNRPTPPFYHEVLGDLSFIRILQVVLAMAGGSGPLNPPGQRCA